MLAKDLSVMAVRLTRWLRAADTEPALTGPEASALAVIIHSGGIGPSALAELEQVRRPTVSRTVNALVDRGLVAREPDPEDGRAHCLRATEAGLALWQSGQMRRIAPLAERIAELSEPDRARLGALLEILDRITTPPSE